MSALGQKQTFARKKPCPLCPRKRTNRQVHGLMNCGSIVGTFKRGCRNIPDTSEPAVFEASVVPRRNILDVYLRRRFLWLRLGQGHYSAQRKRGRSRGLVVISWATGAGGIRSQNLQAMGGALLLPVTTAALAAAIFAADTITDLEIAVPVFYTAIILLSVELFKKERHCICRHSDALH